MNSPEQHFERFRSEADSEALAAVFDALAPELLLVAAHLVPTGTEAEDLVQATFLDAIEKAPQWDGARRLAPWLIGILVNHARSERRRHGRVLEPDRLLLGDECGPEATAATEESMRLIHEAVAAMPGTYRQVLNLRLLHGLTPTQIAQALDCPIATVKTRLQRGLAMLRKALPPSLAASLAMLAVSGRGLAQVRQAVLDRASTTATTAIASTTAALGAGLLMKKLSITTVVALGCVSLWSLVRPPAELAAPLPDASIGASVANTANLSAANQAPTAHLEPNSPGTPERLKAATTGGIELEFVWQHDDSPARNILVWMEPDGRPDLSRAMTTNASGTVRLKDVQSQAYRINGPSLSQLVFVRAGQTASERIEVQAPFLLTGVVVDRNGYGVGGAEIFAQDLMSALDTMPRRIAVAAPDGSFQAAADRIGYLWAGCDGYAASPCDRYAGGHRDTVRLVLGGPAGSVRGVVRSADGQLAANAHLMLVNRSDPNRCQAPVHLHTNAAGVFGSRRLAGGAHLLVAQAEHHAATSVTFDVEPAGIAQLDVQLERGGTLTGSVYDDRDTPVRATVLVQPGWGGSSTGWIEALRPLYLSYRPKCESGADGTYRLEHVPTGFVSVAIQPHGRHQNLDVRLQVEEDATHERDFEVVDPGNDQPAAPRIELRGRVIDPDGAPLKRWRVRIRSSHGATRTVSTDEQGVFRAMVRRDSTMTLGAIPPGQRSAFAWARQSGVIPSANPVDLQVRHLPSHGSWLLGRAVAAGGGVPASVRLQLRRIESGQTHAPALALKPNGSFEWGPCPPGRYAVSLAMPTGASVLLSTVDLGPKQRLDLGVVQPKAPGTIEVRVQPARGNRIDPDELTMWDEAGNRTSNFQCGADGTWRSTAVPPAVFTLSVWGEGFARTEQQVVVTSQRATPILVEVKPAATVSFRLRGGGGGGVDGASLTLRTESGKWVLSRVLAQNAGKAHLTRGLSPGRYQFEATAGEGRTASGTFEVVGLEPQTVDVVLKR